MLLLVVHIGELKSTLLTSDILVYLKQLNIVEMFHTDLTGKETSTYHIVRAAICVALSPEVALSHKKFPGKKETGGGGMAWRKPASSFP